MEPGNHQIKRNVLRRQLKYVPQSSFSLAECKSHALSKFFEINGKNFYQSNNVRSKEYMETGMNIFITFIKD